MVVWKLILFTNSDLYFQLFTCVFIIGYLMSVGHLYAPFEIGLGESTVVRWGQGGEEEGQEDDDLKVKVILAS